MSDDDKKVDPFETVGVSGLKRAGGYVLEEWLPELQSHRGRRVMRQMIDSDPIIGAGLLAIDLLSRNVPWSTEPVSNEKNDVEASTFLESCRTDMSYSWNDTIAEILTFVPWGWEWSEIVYKVRGGDSDDPKQHSKYDDNRIGWRKIAPRAQETLSSWDFDADGGVRAMIQQAPPDYQIRRIPIEKSLLFRARAIKGNPEPPGILRNVYEPYYFKKSLSRIEGIGVERDLAGIPIIWLPAEILAAETAATKAQLASYQKLATNVRRDEQEGILMPLVYDKDRNKRYDFTLLSSAGQRQHDTDKIIVRYDHRIAMALLTDFMLLGTKTVGSYALSQDKTSLLSVALNTYLDIVEEAFNTHAVPRLFKLNTFQVKQYPKLKHGKVEAVDVEKFAQAIQALSQSGMPLFPDVELENYIRSQMKLPALKEDELQRRREEDKARGAEGKEVE
ncbi:MAG: hypothetical protein WBV94_25135 [Blastocatellia bacterium]